MRTASSPGVSVRCLIRLGLYGLSQQDAIADACRLKIDRTGWPLLPDLSQLDDYGRLFLREIIGSRTASPAAVTERVRLFSLIYPTTHTTIRGEEGSRHVWRTYVEHLIRTDRQGTLRQLDTPPIDAFVARQSAVRRLIPGQTNRYAPNVHILPLFGRLLLRWMLESQVLIASGSDKGHDAAETLRVQLQVMNEFYPMVFCDPVSSQAHWHNFVVDTVKADLG